jgi:hypothetical protein
MYAKGERLGNNRRQRLRGRFFVPALKGSDSGSLLVNDRGRLGHLTARSPRKKGMSQKTELFVSELHSRIS